jgi:hypothetical protein
MRARRFVLRDSPPAASADWRWPTAASRLLGFEFWVLSWPNATRLEMSEPETQNSKPETASPGVLPPCPHLPPPRDGLDWRRLHAFRESHRGAEFYFACLEYGHALWRRGLAARALLCLDRALGAELSGDEPVLRDHPLPYAAMAWLIAHTPREVFLGNPRVHFQHYADRMNEPRRDQRRWRAWACWALARAVRPDLPGDPRHRVVEPTLDEIEAALRAHGHRGEAALWQVELERARALARG